VALVMYDLTTLHFDVADEDQLRKVGMSKEHRVDPQITVGLLVTADGFPLEVAMFEGNQAETKTLVPVIEQFSARHNIKDLVVVADSGMLSAANLNALEDANYRFIVGSRQSRVPYDLSDYFTAHGNYVEDNTTIETSRKMGTGKDRRSRRVVYHYSFKRRKRDERTINAQVAKAEKVAGGDRPIARDRFVSVTGDGDQKKAQVNWTIIERARFSAGFKGYVTNIDAETLDGAAVVAAYHDLWHVEESFRMTKSDLAARPIFHRKRDSIEAHLTVVFAALAVGRYLQHRTGLSIKRLVQTLRPLQTVTITLAGHRVTAQPRLDADTAALLEKIADLTGALKL
jgi:transposase